MFKQLRPALASLLVLSMVTGVAYPLLVTGIAQLAFPEQANGSLLRDAEGKVLGSRSRLPSTYSPARTGLFSCRGGN
ncbi:potassium-transporting ATPase subunit C, partial [Pseudomonas aeruginosa]|uniref:potassium-transporting ATPase subunit C n=1 Tax=Pseudomonas aeruginosa TaxID=287 RepID=UPI00396A15DD